MGESRQFDVCKLVICETTCSYHYKVWSIFNFFYKITEKTRECSMIGCQQPSFMAQLAVSGPNCLICPSCSITNINFVIGQAKSDS